MSEIEITVSSAQIRIVKDALLRDGKQITTARLERLAELAVRNAREIADAELNRRDKERSIRNRPEGEGWSKHYHDSFEVSSVSDKGRNLTISIQNRHPAAKWIEYGTSEFAFYDIPETPQSKRLAWPVPFHLNGDPSFFRSSVRHPGVKKKLIMERALEKLRSQQKSLPQRVLR